MSADPAPICPALVLTAARAWVGTPWRPACALRAAGVDCAGLARGVIRDVTGLHLPAPAWDATGATWGAAMLEGARAAGLVPRAGPAQPGDLVAYRIGRRAHVGVSTGAGVIHADQVAGVVETPGALGRVIVAAWSIPARADLDTAPTARAADLEARIRPPVDRQPPQPAGGWWYEIALTHTGATLAEAGDFPDRAAAAAYLAPWGLPIKGA